MLSLRVIFWGVFIFILFQLSLFGGVLDKTIISLTYVGYEMFVATRYYPARRLSTISYPTRARGIIFN